MTFHILPINFVLIFFSVANSRFVKKFFKRLTKKKKSNTNYHSTENKKKTTTNTSQQSQWWLVINFSFYDDFLQFFFSNFSLNLQSNIAASSFNRNTIGLLSLFESLQHFSVMSEWMNATLIATVMSHWNLILLYFFKKKKKKKKKQKTSYKIVEQNWEYTHTHTHTAHQILSLLRSILLQELDEKKIFWDVLYSCVCVCVWCVRKKKRGKANGIVTNSWKLWPRIANLLSIPYPPTHSH